MQSVLELLHQLMVELPIDKSRLYVTGLSAGGYGTWEIIERRPDLFAAAIPICGCGDVALAARLKDLPIWAFHGDKDTAVEPQCTLVMIEAIRKAGGKPKVTIYPGVGHNCCDMTYANPAVLAWLFAQRN
jgi:predicted peptidase